jgi:lipoprotein-anchoring transpeptidase ErfK/SrfK
MSTRCLRPLIFAALTSAVVAQDAPVQVTAGIPAVSAPVTVTPGAESGDVAPVRPVLISQRERTARLQIFLDQKLFSPGMIDGKPGRFLVGALMRWQRANGFEETGVLDEKVPLDSIHPVYVLHTMAKEELKWIGDSPGKPSEQAKKKYLPYSNYTEFLAERYHCSVDFLKGLNPNLKFGALKPGDEIRVPNVEPFKIEMMPATGNYPEVPEFANRRIVIDRRATILELYEGDQLLATVPIAPGSPAHPTPAGRWRVVGVAAMPTFRWDKGVLNHGVRTENYFMLPAGPNNPVGVGWLGLNKPGIGIHGTNNPYSIGTWASHGCMRTANWDIARLSKMVTKGIVVEIK